MPGKTQKGVRFGEPDGVALEGDLYTPEGPGPHPILLAAPGGGWRRGDKAQLARWGAHLADAGIAVFAIDYRRATAGKVWPKNLEDVTAAVAFLRDSGPGLGLDPGRLGILGASAGAHLAALAALQEADRKTAPVRVLVGVYGVYDLMAHWQADLSKNMTADEDPTVRMLGATPFDDPQLYVDASPLRQIRYSKNALKTLLIWGDRDGDILPAQSEAFATALRQSRAFVRTLTVPGAGHFWFSEEPIGPNTFCGDVADRLVAFLKQHLAGA